MTDLLKMQLRKRRAIKPILKLWLLNSLWLFFSLAILYSLCWVISLNILSFSLNKKYANKKINIVTNTDTAYFIKFTKVKPTGFPLKFGLRVTGWVEESNSNYIEYNTPFVVGYDLLKSSLFAHFSGDINAWYQPVQAGFGAKIIKDNCVVSLKLPLTIKLLKFIKNSDNNWFELINFVNHFEYSSDKARVLDFVDNSTLYESDFELFETSFIKSKYYNSINDVMLNIPRQIELSYVAKVNLIKKNSRLTPENLFHSFVLPFAFNGNAKISVETKSQPITELMNNVEIKISYSPDLSAQYKFSPTIFYKCTTEDQNKDVKIRASANFMFETGFFDNLYSTLEYIYSRIPPHQMNPITSTIFAYALSSKEPLALSNLENEEYKLDLDFDFENHRNDLYFNINNFALFSSKSGVRLNNVSRIKLEEPKQWTSKGLLMINNSSNVLDIVLNSIYVLVYSNKENSNPQNKNLYLKATKHFLQTISDHPNSNSEDLSYEYDLDSRNLANSTVGKTILPKLKILYYLALYKQATEQNSKISDVLEGLKTFAPKLGDEQEQYFEQIIKNSIVPQVTQEVPEEIWQELTK